MNLTCNRCAMLYQNAEKIQAPVLKERGPCPKCKFGILILTGGPKTRDDSAMDEAFIALSEERENFIHNWLSGKELKRTKSGMILDGAAGALGLKQHATTTYAGAAKFAGVVKSHLPSSSSGGSSGASGFASTLRSGVTHLASGVRGGIAHAVGPVASAAKNVGAQGLRGAEALATPMVAPLSHIEGLTHARTLAETILRSLLQEAGEMALFGELVTELPTLITEVAQHLTPFIGAGMDVAKTGKSCGQLGFAIYREIRTRRKEVRLSLSGDANAALDSLRVLLDRQIGKSAYAASRSAVAAASKTALTLLDGGALSHAAIGSVAAICDLLTMIAWIIVEMREAKAGNKVLKSGEHIDASVFDKCPLLGCYILTCSTKSNILNWMAVEMGSDNWMAEIERMSRKIDPILAIASQRIADARWELPLPPGVGLPKYHAGQVIRSDDGDILIKLDRLKQRITGAGKAAILHPKITYKEWKAHKITKARVAGQFYAG